MARRTSEHCRGRRHSAGLIAGAIEWVLGVARPPFGALPRSDGTQRTVRYRAAVTQGLSRIVEAGAAAAVVEQLRGDELANIRDAVAADRRPSVLKGLYERGRAQELVRQQYTGRYPFELLQNANDAAAEPGAFGASVHFELTDQALIVADQGAGFDPTKVEAICTLGRSSKDPRKAVGYKGLGFKSVGQITSSPQIISVDAAFTFDASRARAAVEEAAAGPLDQDQRVPEYAFPFPLRPEDLGADRARMDVLLADGFRSLIRLPFKTGVNRSDVESHLHDNLTPRLLLLLDAVEDLQVRTPNWSLSARVVRERRADHDEVLLESDDGDEHWLVFRRKVPIPDRSLVANLEGAWKDVNTVGVAVGVPLATDNIPIRSQPQALHVYFPTEEATGSSLLLHADFVLELDRRHIAASPEAEPFNRWLAGELATLTGEVAERLADLFPADGRVVDVLAPLGPPRGFAQELWQATVDSLAARRFVPLMDGRVTSPADAAVLPNALRGLEEAYAFLDTSELSALVARSVDASEDACDFLLGELGSEEISGEAVAMALKTPEPSREEDFYKLILEWSGTAGETVVGGLLAHAHCVRDRSGAWILPADAFFPRRSDEIPLPQSIGISVIEIPELDGLRSVLAHAGVKPFEWREIITTRVLPLLTAADTPPEHREDALSALRAYYDAERAGDDRTRERIGGVLVLAATASGERPVLNRADKTYFSQDWLGNDRLERIYGGFGQSEFLAQPRPEDADDVQKERAFLAWLGVAQGPRVERKSTQARDVYMSLNLHSHPHRSAGDDWWRWQRSEAFRGALDCGQDHPQSQQLRSSVTVDRFREVVETATSADRRAALWDALAERWPEYQAALWAEIHCQHTGHAGSRSRMLPSLFGMLISELAWVPAVVAGSPTTKPPSAIWRLSVDTPRRVADRVARFALPPGTPPAHAMCEDLEVVDAARPSPHQVVELLRELERELAEADGAPPEGLREAARWAMRALDDCLGGPADLSPGHIPLLAHIGGHLVFDPAPVISQDPMLAEVFGAILPILDGDRDLRTLHRLLDLRLLDKEVTQRPIAREPREDERHRIVALVDAAKPFLAALAIAAVPSREAQIYRGLGRLEIVVCRELEIEYELDGERRHFSDPVSHIAIRQEKEGSVRRNFGTAYLQISEGEAPPWFSLGPQLAEYLDVPSQGDAFSLLLDSQPAARRAFLESRKVGRWQVEHAREQLATAPSDDVPLDLDGWPAIEVRIEESDDTPPPQVTQQQAPDTQDEPIEQRPPPALDIDGLVVREAPAQAASLGRPSVAPRLGDGSSARQVDRAEQSRLQHESGSRGEEAAFQAERRALQERGSDPDLVVWRSKQAPESPYDIESIDRDGQRIWIEVKSTTSSDPEEPFFISAAELLFAAAQSGRYYIYRVTDVNSAEPQILSLSDPLGRIRRGEGYIALDNARVSLSTTDGT